MLSLKCFRPGGDCFEDPEWKKSCLKMGDVDANEVMDAIARRVSAYSSPDLPHEWSAPDPPSTSPGVLLLECPGAEQLSIGVGVSVMPRNHPDFLPLRVVNQILGGGGSSRLFSRLREEQGLTYGVYSQLDCGRWGGDLTATMQVAPDKSSLAIRSLSTEIKRMGEGTIAPEELAHAIDYLVGSFPQRASGLAGVSSLTMAAWLHGLPSSVWRDYQASIQAVTHKVAQATARHWLRPDNFSWVFSGSPSVLDSISREIQVLQKPVKRGTLASFSA